MSRTSALAPDDLEWEEPPGKARNRTAITATCETVGTMRSALLSNRGKWAVLDTFEGGSTAGYRSFKLNKLRDEGESRLLGLEFTARRPPDGGSKLYVRAAHA